MYIEHMIIMMIEHMIMMVLVKIDKFIEESNYHLFFIMLIKDILKL